MYDILKKGRKLSMFVQCQYDLFDKIVKPFLFYGCEIWGYTNTDIIERIHLKFCKMLLNYKKKYTEFHGIIMVSCVLPH